MKRMGWRSADRPGQLRQICAEFLRPARNTGAQQSDEQIVNSPLFATLMEYLQTAGRSSVLDLGPALGSNVAFFGELHCKMQIADCASALIDLNARDDVTPDGYTSELEQLLPVDGMEPADVILTWDLLNYLDKPLYAAFMQHLSRLVSGDTWLHGYICSRREMAVLPQYYRLDSVGRVAVRTMNLETRPCPCYSQQTLRTLMPRFGVSRATLLQNGMQEYLFKGQGIGHRSQQRRG